MSKRVLSLTCAKASSDVLSGNRWPHKQRRHAGPHGHKPHAHLGHETSSQWWEAFKRSRALCGRAFSLPSTISTHPLPPLRGNHPKRGSPTRARLHCPSTGSPRGGHGGPFRQRTTRSGHTAALVATEAGAIPPHCRRTRERLGLIIRRNGLLLKVSRVLEGRHAARMSRPTASRRSWRWSLVKSCRRPASIGPARGRHAGPRSP